ncbi:hypothetical protein O181_035368 [Austropuccinia psidii MF-1]|uniref:Uncharacterized protein n=1 Tax=Austropuccinia psidii MF-1 TaxID=1389203 RepID=A0A9Q3H870_9BASI|nr:hypothetical protein [Austropuccinia psidii MF-1]
MLRWKIAIQKLKGHTNIFHKAENIQKNLDSLSRLPLANTPENKAYVPLEVELQIPIEGINITHLGTEFFKEARKSYKPNRNCAIMTTIIEKDYRDTVLSN